MITDERYKQFMKELGMENNKSLFSVLKQCANESAIATQRRICESLQEFIEKQFAYESATDKEPEKPWFKPEESLLDILHDFLFEPDRVNNCPKFQEVLDMTGTPGEVGREIKRIAHVSNHTATAEYCRKMITDCYRDGKSSAPSSEALAYYTVQKYGHTDEGHTVLRIIFERLKQKLEPLPAVEE